MKTQDELDKELELLVKQYGVGKIYTIRTPLSQDDDCEYATLFLLKTDRKQHEAIAEIQMKHRGTLKPIEAILKMTWKGGDPVETVINNDDAMFGCDEPLFDFLKKKSGEIKKN